MSTYSATPVKLEDITLPADGEDVDAASVNVPIESIADGVMHVRLHSRCFGWESAYDDVGADGWPPNVEDTEYRSNAGTGVRERIRIPVGDGVDLESVDILFKVTSSHLPTTKLKGIVRRLDLTTGTATDCCSVTQASGADAAGYYASGAMRTLNLPLTTAKTCDATKHVFYLEITAETGGSAAADENRVYGFRAVFAATP